MFWNFCKLASETPVSVTSESLTIATEVKRTKQGSERPSLHEQIIKTNWRSLKFLETSASWLQILLFLFNCNRSNTYEARIHSKMPSLHSIHCNPCCEDKKSKVVKRSMKIYFWNCGVSWYFTTRYLKLARWTDFDRAFHNTFHPLCVVLLFHKIKRNKSVDQPQSCPQYTSLFSSLLFSFIPTDTQMPPPLHNICYNSLFFYNFLLKSYSLSHWCTWQVIFLRSVEWSESITNQVGFLEIDVCLVNREEQIYYWG